MLLLDDRERRYMVTLQVGGAFHFHRGILYHDELIGAPEGTSVRTPTGTIVVALRPTFSEYVLKMKRGAQVIYPKDIAMILMHGDVHPGARVLEAGAGSGALTMGLLRAVGSEGRVVTYELREDFAKVAQANVDGFFGKAENLTIRLRDVYEDIEETDLDRVILDVPEPWRVVPGARESLRTGGIYVAYLPTILQVATLVETLRADPAWSMIATFEALVRTWHVDGRSVRPDHRMVAHTGFITTARRVVVPEARVPSPDAGPPPPEAPEPVDDARISADEPIVDDETPIL